MSWRGGVATLGIVELTGDDASGWKANDTVGFAPMPVHEATASFSPDGRFIAYVSFESGEIQVYVRRFPSGDGKTLISLEGSRSAWPTWSSTGLELIFGTRVGEAPSRVYQLFTAGFQLESDSLVPDTPVPWQGATYHVTQGIHRGYDVHPDGKRALVRRFPAGDTPPIFDHLVLFENLFDYLREQVPTGKN